MTLTASAELLHLLARKPARDPMLVAGWESGEIATQAAKYRAIRHEPTFGGRFSRSRYQQTPDRRRSIERRRTLAATWPMPPAMCGKLTPCQVAYAKLVRDHVDTGGLCDRTLDELAARAGMCSKTAQRAQNRLAELGWITVEIRERPGLKNLPNVVRIVSPEWLMWISVGPKTRSTPIGGHQSPATENILYSRGEKGLPEKGQATRLNVDDPLHCALARLGRGIGAPT